MKSRLHIILAVFLLASGCNPGATQNDTAASTVSDWKWNLPSYVPEPWVPADNPMSEAKFQLGRYLYYDKRLSSSGTYSCSTCHIQAFGFTSGTALPVGVNGDILPRSSMSPVNSAFNASYTWANPNLVTLERQAEVPLYGDQPAELGINSSNQWVILASLQADSKYQTMFADAFPSENNPINYANIIKAIACFERGLISFGSKYDQWLQGKTSLTAAEYNGYLIFNSELGECYHCHSGFNFTNHVTYKGLFFVQKSYHNNGDYNLGAAVGNPLANGNYPAPNWGLYTFTGIATDMGKFKVPTLRNIDVTAPYDIDGAVGTLQEVMDNYQRGGKLTLAGPNMGDGALNPYRDTLIGGMGALTVQNKADIIAFMKTLTDTGFLTNPRFGNPFVP